MFRLMIVDDEKIVLNGIHSLIEKRMTLPFKPDIVTASSAAAALEILNVFKPDLILTDIRMPVIDGFAFIEQARKMGIDCDFAILTSHADFSYAKRAISLRAEEFILKPVDTEELKRVLLSSYQKKLAAQNAEEREGISLLRNLLLYDIPADEITPEEDVFQMIFPHQFFTIVLIQTEEADHNFSSAVEQELSLFYPKCHTFYFYQKKQYITICNHDEFFIDTAPLNQIFKHIFINQSYFYSISISSNSWKELHNLYTNAQLRIFYQELYPRKQDIADISFITYWDCVKIFMEPDEKLLLKKLQSYMDKIFSQYPESPDFYREIYHSFIHNCNIYLNNIGAPIVHAVFQDYKLSSVQALMDIILQNILVYRQSSSNSQKNINEPDSASMLLSYIDHHYTEDISLESLAEAINMHPNYVCSLFKKHFGQSYLTYLHQKRLDKAKELLRSAENYTLESIASKIGYNSSNQLLRIFKKYEHMTPGEYRKIHE